MNTTLQDLGITAGDVFLEISYLLAAVFFVIGLKLMSHPESARKGNFYAAGGMGLAMVTTLFLHRDASGAHIGMINIVVIVVAIAVGGIFGTIVARRVKMTAMPQLVSFFNATGGAASALVALMEYSNPDNTSALVTLLGLIIGTIAFSGSMIAYGKLDGKIGDIFAGWVKYFNLLMIGIIVALTVYMLAFDHSPEMQTTLSYILLTLALIYGIMFVMPIGGADMPVVISLLNSLTGIAAAMAGFIYGNQAMILGGIFVGSAGSILTLLMCKAMNRSLINVIVGSFGGGGAGVDKEQGNIKEITLSDAAVLLSYSQKVVIVPGYGLAVAQAQHACNDLVKLLESKGVEVKFAIHPVAGRMPGHMNVLLAEADVPYTKLVEMDNINPDMPNTDVTVVIGANDVVNPASYDDPSSPIYGMPIINAHESKNIIVMKRGMGKGYAGIENFLFFNEKTRMLFGHAKDTLQALVGEIKEL
ncbi:MAG: NAD(P)(+) transhydrogenase (Re/Si-specific) subunit beta [Bacteroidetes bacterium]|nr:NAD(P)(+) transhydrogenase (Re/Si-specific) subunit beta [Bacteroidota bacterium]MBL6944868.1 NAD(P)(+) transhydrogenase (Re/Si-specific) subunit beta [Bacteroidales bacterium]